MPLKSFISVCREPSITPDRADVSFVEITELPDGPPPSHHPQHDGPLPGHHLKPDVQYGEVTNPASHSDFVSGLQSPKIIPQPPQFFPPQQMSHLSQSLQTPNSMLNFFPPQHHQSILPPTSLLSPHHRRVHSLYSHGQSLADQILGESDLPGINRSLSFGMRGIGADRGTRLSPVGRVVGGTVRTNIDEHIEILNQHKSSIMNLLKEDF